MDDQQEEISHLAFLKMHHFASRSRWIINLTITAQPQFEQHYLNTIGVAVKSILRHQRVHYKLDCSTNDVANVLWNSNIGANIETRIIITARKMFLQ